MGVRGRGGDLGGVIGRLSGRAVVLLFVVQPRVLSRRFQSLISVCCIGYAWGSRAVFIMYACMYVYNICVYIICVMRPIAARAIYACSSVSAWCFCLAGAAGEALARGLSAPRHPVSLKLLVLLFQTQLPPASAGGDVSSASSVQSAGSRVE